MIKIAIVDDEQDQSVHMQELVNRYASEHGVEFDVSVFDNPLTFLDSYNPSFDIIFMDVKMPEMNGIDAARALRRKDSRVLLYFITTARQYALKGYEVEALDYIIKPLDYKEFQLKIARAIMKLDREDHFSLLVKTENGFVRLRPADITYIEVSGHFLIYHTVNGDYRVYGTLKSVEEKLDGKDFTRCNNYLLVNLKYVTGVNGLSADVYGESLQISHPRRKAFSEAFLRYKGR
ncbi:MAG: response regulator transcription factor [Lachnospiraceae bacterium]|nr:response regulator transcription factor [Lachnospiraceae bacterium]